MTIRVKLAAIAKDEAAYIPQWIHHHSTFGFEEFEIWLNNTTDNSIDILQEIQFKHPELSIKFKVADEFLNMCLSENLQFQQNAYSQIYSETLKSEGFSHILFLDLDEFWVPEDFQTTIVDFITPYADADAISFQWMIDTPDIHKPIFTPPFNYSNRLQKNRHVKTLTKLTDKMSELSVHNHIIKDGVYILADGSAFPGNDRETINKSLVPISHQKINCMKPEKAFILHQINRTPIEYLSSLLRGRGHKNDQSVFKANRIGYILDGQSAPPTDYRVDLGLIFEHNRSLAGFSYTIDDQLRLAQEFIINRFWSAIHNIRNNPELLHIHRDQIRGVKINDFLDKPLPYDQIISAIDKAKFTSEGVVVEGWAYDALTSCPITIVAEDQHGRQLEIQTYRHDRPDVEKIYPDAPKGCGFKATIRTDKIIRFSIRSSEIGKTTIIEPTDK